MKITVGFALSVFGFGLALLGIAMCIRRVGGDGVLGMSIATLGSSLSVLGATMKI